MTENEQKLHAYRALDTAALRIGANNYQKGINAHVKAGRHASTYRYQPTPAHQLIVEAMPKLMRDELTPEQAMGLLHNPEVFRERMGK